MKLTTLALLTLFASAMADTDLTPAELSALKGYDAQQIEDLGDKLEDKVVKIKFTYRGSHLEKLDDGSILGELAYERFTNTTAKDKMGFVPIIVPAEQIEWYRKITTDYNSKKAQFVIAKMARTDRVALVGYILGREVKTDFKGSHIVWGTAP